MFGCSLAEQQRIILERSGALKLVVMTDSDEAGMHAREKIAKQCERMYNIQFVDLLQKDVGDMSVEEINTHVKPQL
jgi:5S rRNA maturation endonuclease (ribonuclease M5)